MTQVEIEFFWPLTEQIPLDLDFPPIEDYTYRYFLGDGQTYEESMRIDASGNFFMGIAPATWPAATNFKIQPSPLHVGHWEVSGKDFQICREKRPSWLHRKLNKLLIGWQWKDK
jgi:hypothetical protein